MPLFHFVLRGQTWVGSGLIYDISTGFVYGKPSMTQPEVCQDDPTHAPID